MALSSGSSLAAMSSSSSSIRSRSGATSHGDSTSSTVARSSTRRLLHRRPAGPRTTRTPQGRCGRSSGGGARDRAAPARRRRPACSTRQLSASSRDGVAVLGQHRHERDRLRPRPRTGRCPPRRTRRRRRRSWPAAASKSPSPSCGDALAGQPVALQQLRPGRARGERRTRSARSRRRRRRRRRRSMRCGVRGDVAGGCRRRTARSAVATPINADAPKKPSSSDRTSTLSATAATMVRTVPRSRRRTPIQSPATNASCTDQREHAVDGDDRGHGRRSAATAHHGAEAAAHVTKATDDARRGRRRPSVDPVGRAPANAATTPLTTAIDDGGPLVEAVAADRPPATLARRVADVTPGRDGRLPRAPSSSFAG